MKNYQIPTTFLLIVGFICCKPASQEYSYSIDSEIETLTTFDLQRQYLEQIMDLTEQMRFKEREALQNFGFDSREHKESVQKMKMQDSIHLEKMEKYLVKYTHPSLSIHGKKAVGAPLTVLLQAPGGNATKERNFRYIYGAYKKQDLDDAALTYLLNEMYDAKFGHRMEWNRTFRAAEEIDTLMRELNLKKIAATVR